MALVTLERRSHASCPCTCRAPTSTDGLAAFCKDTFFGRCRLQLWKRDGSGRRSDTPIVDAYSTTAALEVRVLLGPVPGGAAPKSCVSARPPVCQ